MRKRPESRIEFLVIAVARQLGLWIHKTDSQKHMTKFGSMSRRGNCPSGWPDLTGPGYLGQFCGIEVKATGKLNTLRPSQKTMLLTLIQKDCFACVVDRPQSLVAIYTDYRAIQGSAARQEYLMNLVLNPQKIFELHPELLSKNISEQSHLQCTDES